MCLGKLLKLEIETYLDKWVHFSMSSKHYSTCRTCELVHGPVVGRGVDSPAKQLGYIPLAPSLPEPGCPRSREGMHGQCELLLCITQEACPSPSQATTINSLWAGKVGLDLGLVVQPGAS